MVNSELIFLIPRHVGKPEHSQLWIEQYSSIRKFYSDARIVYIDNNSNKEFLTTPPFELQNCDILESEIPEARLFTPFHYYIKYYSNYKRAVILHDGFFFHQNVDFSDVQDARFFWHFTTHAYDKKETAKYLFNLLTNSEHLYPYYLKKKWWGCLGCMIVIESQFILRLQEKYNLLALSNVINTLNTCEFERTLGCLCFYESEAVRNRPSFYGNCSTMITTPFTDYIENKDKYLHLPVMKIFNYRL